MKNLWIVRLADGSQTQKGANDFAEAVIRYKKNGVSTIAVKIEVRYNNGQPIIDITGDPLCNWNIGRTRIDSKTESIRAQLTMFNTQD